jgi:hypothetical protein
MLSALHLAANIQMPPAALNSVGVGASIMIDETDACNLADRDYGTPPNNRL